MISDRDLKISLPENVNWGKLKGESVLVTGATGRLGIYLAQALIKANEKFSLDLQVYLLFRSPKKLLKEYGDLLNNKNVHCILQDIKEPIKCQEKISYIFHTAGLASPADFTYYPIETLWGHVQGTRNVLEFGISHETKKILYVSTVEIYGAWEKEGKIKENDMGPLKCNNVRACYPEAKRICETMLACYEQEHKLDYVIVRLSHTLGPGISIDDGRAFAEFLRCALNDKDIVLQTSGSAIRTYTYTADAVAAMFLALLNGNEKSYNIAATENQISIKELAKLIASFSKTGNTKVCFSGTEPKLKYLPFRLGMMDCTKIESLGWQPQVGIREIFQWTLESFLSV